jgi:hypothetical protein
MMSFAARRGRLSARAQNGSDMETQLLAYLYVAGRDLEPIIDPSRSSCVVYRGLFPESRMLEAAERLVRRGHFEQRFFDRFHACSSCGSMRLNVREECLACRSPNLGEVAILHHFRCAHQAPESEFVSGHNLICPKCRQHLRHYGSDYDKPGHALHCRACGSINTEPEIGFSCLDCGAHMDGDAVRQRDVFRYALTDTAISALVEERIPARELLLPPTDALPDALRDRLVRLAAEGRTERLNFADVEYRASNRIIRERGLNAFQALRRQFLENLHCALLDYGGQVYPAPGERDFVLVFDADASQFLPVLTQIAQQCQDTLAIKIDPVIRIIDPRMAHAA